MKASGSMDPATMVRIAHAMSELSGSEVEVDFEGFLSMLCELPWRKILPSENQGIMPQVPLPLPQVPQVPRCPLPRYPHVYPHGYPTTPLAH